MATTSWSQSAGMTSDTDTDNVTDDLTPTDTSYTQRSGMVSDTEVDNVEDFAEQAEASKDAAAASAAAAALSETAAETAETNAETAETNASSSATAAATSATSATSAATAAATSATSAAGSATAASASEAAAETAESNASVSETNAATSATNAATSATNAATSETNAATSETNASTSATSASTSAATATTQATSAATSAANAATSEANAGTSEANAATSATNAANSATTASTQATNAATSATNAATSETNAATSATAAASSATSAQASKDAALAALDNFDDRYLGQKASDPTVDNDGDALISGALYFNSTDDVMKVYEGSLWVAAYASLSGALLSTNNLSDVDNVATARTNLGLGTAATTASSDYATAAQGALADTAVQPNDSPSFGSVTVTGTVDGRDIAADGAKLDGIEASADVTDTANVTSAGALMDSEVVNLAQVKAFDSGDYATAAQGTLADSAVQPNDSPTFANIDASGNVTASQFTGGGAIIAAGSSSDGTNYSTQSVNYQTATRFQITPTTSTSRLLGWFYCQMRAQGGPADGDMGNTAQVHYLNSSGSWVSISNFAQNLRTENGTSTGVQEIAVTFPILLDQSELNSSGVWDVAIRHNEVYDATSHIDDGRLHYMEYEP